MGVHHAIFFMFIIVCLSAYTGLLTFPEPLQDIIIDFGIYFIVVAILAVTFPYVMGIIMVTYDRDRDIPRSEPWQDEVIEERQPVK